MRKQTKKLHCRTFAVHPIWSYWSRQVLKIQLNFRFYLGYDFAGIVKLTIFASVCSISCFRFCLGMLIERSRFDRITRSLWIIFVGFVFLLSLIQILWYMSDIFFLIAGYRYVDANGCPLSHHVS
jgi:hypothetical protein